MASKVQTSSARSGRVARAPTSARGRGRPQKSNAAAGRSLTPIAEHKSPPRASGPSPAPSLPASNEDALERHRLAVSQLEAVPTEELERDPMPTEAPTEAAPPTEELAPDGSAPGGGSSWPAPMKQPDTLSGWVELGMSLCLGKMSTEMPPPPARGARGAGARAGPPAPAAAAQDSQPTQGFEPTQPVQHTQDVGLSQAMLPPRQLPRAAQGRAKPIVAATAPIPPTPTQECEPTLELEPTPPIQPAPTPPTPTQECEPTLELEPTQPLQHAGDGTAAQTMPPPTQPARKSRGGEKRTAVAPETTTPSPIKDCEPTLELELTQPFQHTASARAMPPPTQPARKSRGGDKRSVLAPESSQECEPTLELGPTPPVQQTQTTVSSQELPQPPSRVSLRAKRTSSAVSAGGTQECEPTQVLEPTAAAFAPAAVHKAAPASVREPGHAPLRARVKGAPPTEGEVAPTQELEAVPTQELDRIFAPVQRQAMEPRQRSATPPPPARTAAKAAAPRSVSRADSDTSADTSAPVVYNRRTQRSRLRPQAGPITRSPAHMTSALRSIFPAPVAPNGVGAGGGFAATVATDGTKDQGWRPQAFMPEGPPFRGTLAGRLTGVFQLPGVPQRKSFTELVKLGIAFRGDAPPPPDSEEEPEKLKPASTTPEQAEAAPARSDSTPRPAREPDETASAPTTPEGMKRRVGEGGEQGDVLEGSEAGDERKPGAGRLEPAASPEAKRRRLDKTGEDDDAPESREGGGASDVGSAAASPPASSAPASPAGMSPGLLALEDRRRSRSCASGRPASAVEGGDGNSQLVEHVEAAEAGAGLPQESGYAVDEEPAVRKLRALLRRGAPEEEVVSFVRNIWRCRAVVAPTPMIPEMEPHAPMIPGMESYADSQDHALQEPAEPCAQQPEASHSQELLCTMGGEEGDTRAQLAGFISHRIGAVDDYARQVRERHEAIKGVLVALQTLI